MTVKEFIAKLRLGNFSSFGCYPYVFYNENGDAYHPSCLRKSALVEARSIRDGACCPIMYHDVYYEGPSLECVECDTPIESAYGDPDDSV